MLGFWFRLVVWSCDLLFAMVLCVVAWVFWAVALLVRVVFGEERWHFTLGLGLLSCVLADLVLFDLIWFCLRTYGFVWV